MTSGATWAKPLRLIIRSKEQFWGGENLISLVVYVRERERERKKSKFLLTIHGVPFGRNSSSQEPKFIV